MDAQTNVEQLSFNFDKEKKKIPIVFFQEPFSKAPIGVPIPDVTPLNPPLGLVPPLPPKIVKLDNTAHLSAPEALMAGIAYAGQNSDSVFGTGRLDVAKYGRLLRSRQLVGVRGAGLPFDGLYYVKSVTHEIKRGSYKQGFSLARNALDLHLSDGADMTATPALRKVPRHRDRTTSTRCRSAASRRWCRMPPASCRAPGRCPACRWRASTAACSPCR